jgi:hypothetical protein
MRKHAGIWLVATLLTLAVGLGFVCVLDHGHGEELVFCSYCVAVGSGVPLPDAQVAAGVPQSFTSVVVLSIQFVAERFAGDTHSRAPPHSLPS